MTGLVERIRLIANVRLRELAGSTKSMPFCPAEKAHFSQVTIRDEGKRPVFSRQFAIGRVVCLSVANHLV